MAHKQVAFPASGDCSPAPAQTLRVALFTDCFLESNGVGTLCREYAAYAGSSGLPFFCAYGGPETKFTIDASLHQLQLRRGPLSFGLDADLLCDPLLTRHRDLAVARLREFRPDLVHITGPGDVSILGRWVASLVEVPVVASWHTNLHEYADRRLQSSLMFLPRPLRELSGSAAYKGTLRAVTAFYRTAHFVAAPNQDMVNLLVEKTGRPAYLMAHGVNTELFTPDRRDSTDHRFCIGYVGRLTPEKNVRALLDLEQNLLAAGARDFRIVVVGDGSEREWLRANVTTAQFTGTLRGMSLATAVANMDVFVFPSLTDTFGLVILEAMASGVPVIVNPETGLRAGVVDEMDGYLTNDFSGGVQRLMCCEQTRRRMGTTARFHACSRTWQGVFNDLYYVYQSGLDSEQVRSRMPRRKFDAARGSV